MSANIAISPLFTDLYELTMAAAYWEHSRHGKATFSLFLRRQPHRVYYVAAGLAAALDMVQNLKFSSGDIDYLNQLGLFKTAFLEYLQAFRFTGDIWALPEGSLFFPDEPILEVTAPMIQAQLLETSLINIIGVHTLIATKAARCVHAAGGRKLIDFALRRTQGPDAGMAVARSTYLAGFDATSNVLAGKRYGIPVAGTMAHSLAQSFTSETQAFQAYARTFPEHTILLIDTYDTLVYKLVRYDTRNVFKLSPGKKTLAAPKQIFRFKNSQGYYEKDIIGHRSEDIAKGEKLLRQVMSKGRISLELPGLKGIRNSFKSHFALLPEPYKQLNNCPNFPVSVSPKLMAIQQGL
jgi:nicotinic acid phosphoribosyltransferase